MTKKGILITLATILALIVFSIGYEHTSAGKLFRFAQMMQNIGLQAGDSKSDIAQEPQESVDEFIARVLHLENDRQTDEYRKRYGLETIDYECAITDPVAYAAFVAWSSEEASVDALDIRVSTLEEEEFGNEAKKEIAEEYSFVKDSDMLLALKELMDILLKARPQEHTGLHYEIYLIKSTDINAYTVGGKIFLTTGIIKECKTVSELASIIGHEIAHNEVGDIHRILARKKFLGEFGEIGLIVKQLLTMSWNQFNEIRADQYGLNLVYAAGYNPCKTIDLWKRMAREFNEDNSDVLAKLFRTHPYSEDRANCARDYIKNTFNITCGK